MEGGAVGAVTSPNETNGLLITGFCAAVTGIALDVGELGIGIGRGGALTDTDTGSDSACDIPVSLGINIIPELQFTLYHHILLI